MFNLPLHPLVVHFPIVLGILLPFAGLTLWWAIKNGHLQQKTWAVIVLIALVYTASAMVTVELGEVDEEKVEKVVAHDVIEEHEEMGETIPWVAGGLLLMASAGFLVPLRNSHRFRMAFALVSFLAVIPLGITGHSGGELVYEYGAANIHLPAKTKALIESGAFYTVHKDHDEDHEKETS